MFADMRHRFWKMKWNKGYYYEWWWKFNKPAWLWKLEKDGMVYEWYFKDWFLNWYWRVTTKDSIVKDAKDFKCSWKLKAYHIYKNIW